MNNISYDSLLLSEFRTVAVATPKNELSEDGVIKAMTVNEELIVLGYTLSPSSVVVLAKSPSVDTFYSRVKSLIGDVKAAPMYPNFPEEVLNLSEAQFRFHQLLHYASTYGMEIIMNTPVLKGWLPNPDPEPKTEDDNILLEAKIIELVPEDEKYVRFMDKILGKAERMTDKEKMMIQEAVANVPIETLSGFHVKFKQNMLELFYTIFSSEIDSADKLSALHAICQHTGDVWKCMDYTLTRERFHLRTAQKKLAVKLFESYSASDFESNIILSGKKGDRAGLVLNYLSYNTYSRSPAHAKIVNSLRSGELRSWESKVTKLIDEHSPDAISCIASHPGVLLRKLAFLVRQGYSCDELSKALTDSAEKLSLQTLITVLSFFGRDDAAWKSDDRCEEAHKVYSICESAIKRKLFTLETKFKGKKVFLDLDKYDTELSTIQCNSKSAEGGYLRSGLAIKVPDSVERLRFFVYWNDERRVDVDLHAAAKAADGSSIYIGWSKDYKEGDSIVFSGDITHSDAAEFIDVVLDPKRFKDVSMNINIYSGAENFKDIDECYVGMMAVDKINQEVKLYNPANCFFSHFLTGESTALSYGYIDIERRALVFYGSNTDSPWSYRDSAITKFNLDTFLNMLITEQGAVVVDNPEDADHILVMEKPSKAKEISILDENFFIPNE